MTSPSPQYTVLQGKFAAYLSWSQPFIHNLVQGLSAHVTNVVICNRTENLDRFATPNIVRVRSRYLVRPAMAMLAAAYLRRLWNPRVMHAHFGWSGIRMLLLKQFLRIPMVTTFGGRDAAVQMNLPHFDRLYQILLSASDQIICVSQDLKRLIVEAGIDPDRIEVIRRGTNLRSFAFVDRSDRPADRPTRFLMVGRLVEKKGHEFAFRAIRQLLDEGLSVELIVVGEGEDYHRLRQLRDSLRLRRVVEFTGVTDHDGVRAHMVDADVFLHCSVTGADGDCEGIPNVVMEAAATGLPVIGTRHGGIVEPVQDQVTGVLVDERDVQGMVAAMRRLAGDKSLRLDMGRAGWKLMHAEFDLDKQIAQHFAIYERLVAQPESAYREMWIPEDFGSLVEHAVQFTPNMKEFSLAELAELLISGEKLRLDPGAYTPKFSILERCYDMKRHLPQPIKFPLKLAFGGALRALIRLREQALARSSHVIERKKSIDSQVLEYFRSGGGLNSVNAEWTLDDLAKFLPADSIDMQHATKIEQIGTGSGA